MPDAESIEKIGDWTIHEKHAEYFVAKKGDNVIGYIIQSFGKGYSSYINTLIAVDADFKVQRISILGHAETPGLGDEIETEGFQKAVCRQGPGTFKGFKDRDHRICTGNIGCNDIEQGSYRRRCEKRSGLSH